LIELSPDKKNLLVFHSRRLCEVVRVTHDDRGELTFDNIVNDNSLFSDVLNLIESKKIDSFRKIESEYFFLNRNALTHCWLTCRMQMLSECDAYNNNTRLVYTVSGKK